MNSHSGRFRHVAICLVSLGLAWHGYGTTATWAQMPAGGSDGRALDASHEVGSGGRNQPIGQPLDFMIGNDIVTGNVGGGRAFRDDVGYRAPGEFRDRLGSDDLFSFRADSFGGAAGTPPAVFTPGEVRIYGSFGSPRTGFYDPGRMTDRLYNIGGASPRTYSLSETPGAEFLMDVTPTRMQVDRLGVVSGQDGRMLEISLSPLLGVRQIERDPMMFEAPRTPGRMELFDFEDLLEDDLLETPALPEGLTRPRDPLDDLPDDMQMQPDADQTGMMRDQNLRDLRMSPSYMIGRQLQAQAVGRGTQMEMNQMVEDRIARLQRALLETPRRADEPAPEAADPYERLLERLRDGELADREPWVHRERQDDFEAPTQEQLDEAEALRREALRRIYGQLEQQDEEGADPLLPDPGTDPLQGELAALLERLNYDLPPMDTFVGEREDRTNELLQQAEEALQTGQYFQAENYYRQAISQTQADLPLARVGLSHSLLGAGMIRTSALQLRRLFEDHPELIAARYDAKLLPSAERLRLLQTDLQRQIEQPGAGAEPGLMMAYLGYQFGSEQMVRYGLAMAEARDPRDPLLPLVRRIWLGRPFPDQPDEAAPALEQPEAPQPLETPETE